jgi:hypothetical protein
MIRAALQAGQKNLSIQKRCLGDDNAYKEARKS